MFAKIIILLPVAICFGMPSREELLRSLILDSNQKLKATADLPPLLASMAAASPFVTPFQDTNQMAQFSPANQQMAQLNLAGGLTNLIKGVLGSLRPQVQSPTPGTTAGNGAMYPNVQSVPVPVPSPRMNMFNPLSFLFSGGSAGGPFSMMMPRMMMRLMENLELF